MNIFVKKILIFQFFVILSIAIFVNSVPEGEEEIEEVDEITEVTKEAEQGSDVLRKAYIKEKRKKYESLWKRGIDINKLREKVIKGRRPIEIFGESAKTDPIEDAKKYSEILTKILNKKDDDKVSKSIKKIKKLNSEILKFFSNKKSYEAFIEIFESNHKNLRKWKKLNKQINVLNYHNFRQILDILEFYENLPNLHEIEQHLKEGFTDKCEKLKKKIESAGITIKEEQKTDEQFKQEINTFFEEEAKIKSNKETKMSKGWKYIRNKLLHKNYDELD